MYRFVSRSGKACLSIAAALAIASQSACDATADGTPNDEAARTAYIVEGQTSAAARAAVTAAGGRVTQDLKIIDAVVAQLTPADRDRLKALSEIRGVFADAPVKVSSVSNAPSVSTVADRFSATSYANNDGTHRWASSWIEFGDDSQPLTGKVGVS